MGGAWSGRGGRRDSSVHGVSQSLMVWGYFVLNGNELNMFLCFWEGSRSGGVKDAIKNP